MLTDKAANDQACSFIAGKIGSIVRDPATADRLTPKDHPFATKRPCVDSGYFDTFNRDNVELVSLRDTPLVTITEKGIRTSGGEYEVDSIVLAIGFDAMTGALNAMDIRGRGGVSLKDLWADGPRTYLGLAIAGLPNLFLITGPGSPSVLTNVLVAIEQHVEWIAGCIEFMREEGIGAIEATAEAQEQWVDHVNEVANRTLYPQANSWYLGANVPGKKRVFMPYIGGWRAYRDRCNEIAADGYSGFSLTQPARGPEQREAAS
jgi:cyclohexanone monooxygenase